MLTQYELKDLLKVHYNTIKRWRESGKIPFIKAGRQYRYELDKVKKALEVNL